jgi:hypothetical protein
MVPSLGGVTAEQRRELLDASSQLQDLSAGIIASSCFASRISARPRFRLGEGGEWVEVTGFRYAAGGGFPEMRDAESRQTMEVRRSNS